MKLYLCSGNRTGIASEDGWEFVDLPRDVRTLRPEDSPMTPRPPRSRSALGPCEFPKCPDPDQRPDSTVHCDHDKSEHLWPHTVPPNAMHHLLIRSLDTSKRADPRPGEAGGGE